MRIPRWHKPFREGQRIELETKAGRLVRGVVMQAGKALVQLNIAQADQPTRVALVNYADMARWRELKGFSDLPNGNWNPSNPDRHWASIDDRPPWIEVG